MRLGRHLKGVDHQSDEYRAFYFKRKVLLLFLHNSHGTSEFTDGEFRWEKIEGNLRRANMEPSLDFRRANTETT